MAAPAQNANRSKATSRSGSPPSRNGGVRNRPLVGHTCAWKIDDHLGRTTFGELKSFCAANPSLDATISRKQLEIAVRKTSAATDRKLRLVRRDVVDATASGHADTLPVVGRVDDDYNLQRPQMRGTSGAQVYDTLRRFYDDESDTIHTTVVAGIVKRYVHSALAGFSLRDHGGVYFVSAKLEDRLFALADFLQAKDIGHITHFGVGGDDHETRVLSEEIRRGVEAQIEKIRSAFDEADLSRTRDRSRLRKKVRRMRGELSEMEELFGFARETLREKDEQVRRLMRDIIRGTRNVGGADLFSGSGEETDASGDGSNATPRGDGAASPGDAPAIDFARSA